MDNENKGGECPRGGQLCKEVIEIKALLPQETAWKQRMEAEINTLRDGLKDVVEFQGGTKVYVAEIKQQLTGLENRLFIFMSDLVKNLTSKQEKGEDSARKERTQTTEKWLSFAKWVIGCTVAALIGYFTKRG